MRFLSLCLLGMILVVSDVYAAIDENKLREEYTSDFIKNLNGQKFAHLMKTHLDISLDYLFGSNVFSSQTVTRPGMAKLLLKESNRHWEEGFDVLKKYIELRGVTSDSSFTTNMNFEKNNVFDGSLDAAFEIVVQNSQTLGNEVNVLYNDAVTKDVDAAYFLEVKAKKETKIAREMIGHYVALKKTLNPLSLDVFDKSL